MSELKFEIIQRLRQNYSVPDIAEELECDETTVRRIMWQEKRKTLPIAARLSTKAERDVAFIQRGINRRLREIELLECNLRNITAGQVGSTGK